ncbi:hypothetical protein RM530_06905 [Algiphilus sp. W345]|uniref:Uncharacterized protein n=1 Tax=Banduia mediterranea TaxID=3075609 RepID=A0ABU2WIN3_9GAMM|nr:hypothetical protein [Algiphilus sp. W345]MDT0497094.1 hypothetical protein [Algiphilus sp. W345]
MNPENLCLLAAGAYFRAGQLTGVWKYARIAGHRTGAGAIASYVLYGLLRDTDNQFRKPYRLGRGTLPGVRLHGLVVALAIGEIGAFVLLLYGFVRTLL